jgi:hypothetical protein
VSSTRRSNGQLSDLMRVPAVEEADTCVTLARSRKPGQFIRSDHIPSETRLEDE